MKNENEMSEGDIETYLTKKCKSNDILCYKFVSPSRTGVPDRIIIANGNTVFVELKAPHKKPRKKQQRIIDTMREHGACVKVINSKTEIDKFINEITTVSV